MILKTLFLRGFIGLRDGSGLEEARIDFDQLPESGLIAITGANGAGKTTLLDNMHPYRLMPYKLRESKTWSPGGFSFYDQCYGRDARKELYFEIGGQLYHSLIMIDAERKKQECYLYIHIGDPAIHGIDQDMWTPLNDGKTGTYDVAIEELLGSPTLFFSSAFRAQDARKLSSYPRSEIKGIIAEMLNIDSVREQGDKSNAVARALGAKVASLDQLHRSLVDAREQLPKASDEVAALESQLETMTSIQLVGTKDQLEQAQNSLKEAEQKKALRSGDEQRLEEKRLALQDLDQQIRALYSDVSNLGRELTEALQWSINERETAEKTLEAKVAELSKRAERSEKILKNAETIRSMVEKEKTLRDRLSHLNERLRVLAEDLEHFRQQQQKIATHKQTLDADQRYLDGLMTRAEMLDRIDCHGDGSGWINQNCPLLNDAIEAKRQSAEYDKRVRTTKSIIDDMERKLRVSFANDPAESIAATKEKISEVEKSIVEAATYTRLVPELEAAEQTLKEAQADIAAAGKEHEERNAAITAASDKEKVRISAQIEPKKEAIKTTNEKMDTLAGEITMLAEELSESQDDAIAKAQSAITRLQAELSEVESSIETAKGLLAVQKTTVAQLEEKVQRLNEIEDEISRINDEIANWKLLAKACSNDGIIALEIDDAGPTIASLANDLLSSCYGSRFSVRLETQAIKSDGGLKETFDITVFDSERGTEKSLTDMSGGEVLWIEDAITRAISLYLLGTSGKTIGTIWTDEKDGALDATRKEEFFAIKRRAMEVGGHQRELFITQTPELVEKADASIRLSRGKLEII